MNFLEKQSSNVPQDAEKSYNLSDAITKLVSTETPFRRVESIARPPLSSHHLSNSIYF